MAKTGQIHIVKAEKDGETTQYWVVMCPRESATEIVQQTIGADWRLTVTGHRLPPAEMLALSLQSGCVQKLDFVP
jgi:hypothetical protein